jgi:hypothetical protein
MGLVSLAVMEKMVRPQKSEKVSRRVSAVPF